MSTKRIRSAKAESGRLIADSLFTLSMNTSLW
jgi:hypothetical protein